MHFSVTVGEPTYQRVFKFQPSRQLYPIEYLEYASDTYVGRVGLFVMYYKIGEVLHSVQCSLSITTAICWQEFLRVHRNVETNNK